MLVEGFAKLVLEVKEISKSIVGTGRRDDLLGERSNTRIDSNVNQRTT